MQLLMKNIIKNNLNNNPIHWLKETDIFDELPT